MKTLVTIIALLICTLSSAQSREVKTYHANGKVREIGYINKDRQCDSTWTQYDENGNVTAVAYYNNGCKVGTWSIHTPDRIIEITYVECRKSLVKETFADGKVNSKTY